jgi:CRISPR/Cas system endoribonuclease Cas6 (RAMP superfamily)
MKKVLFLTVTFMLSLLILVFAEEGFKIELQNSRLEKINYNVFQIDHGFPNWPGPFAVMGGELESGKEYMSPYFRNFGHYVVQWYSTDEKFKNTIEFTVLPPTKKIIIYCDKVVYQ